jgi:fumarate hydratase class II
VVDNAADYRIEHDTMGEVRVPASALYRALTQRAVENFPISGHGLEPAQVAALARIKKAAAEANKRLGVLDAGHRGRHQAAADEVISGSVDIAEHFPIDVYQTGSGTSSNMNMNEVLATLATEKLGSPCTRTTT